MMVGRVKGNAVSSTKVEVLGGVKLLLVLPIDIMTLKEKDDPVICCDGVGAGEGHLVICVGGSSSRQPTEMKGIPSDNSIIAILDTIDIRGERIYEKFRQEGAT